MLVENRIVMTRISWKGWAAEPCFWIGLPVICRVMHLFLLEETCWERETAWEEKIIIENLHKVDSLCQAVTPGHVINDCQRQNELFFSPKKLHLTILIDYMALYEQYESTVLHSNRPSTVLMVLTPGKLDIMKLGAMSFSALSHEEFAILQSLGGK